MEWPQLREQVLAATAWVGALLRSLPAGDLPVARVSWSVAETGAHLVSLPGRYRRMILEPRPFPASLAEDNRRELAAVPERDLRALADRLTAEVTELLDALGPDGRRPAWYFNVVHTAAGIGAIMLTELLMHGLDLARAVREPWPITREQAAACLDGVLPALVGLADPTAARAATGTYHLHLRGSRDWTIRIHDGTVTIDRGRPRRADVHFSADPVAWGRRPWLAVRFGRTFGET